MTGNYPREWPDVVQILLDVLNAEREGVHLPAVPRERPDEFVVVRRTGGGNRGVLDRAQLDIEVWKGEPGSSIEPVTTLALSVAEILRLAPHTAAGSGLSSVVIDTNGFLPDEESDSPRVIITATAVARPVRT